MKRNTKDAGGSDDLRKLAEKKAEQRFATSKKAAQGDADALLHELQVHQIELEMQNEELRASQRELGQSQQKYAELFESAPVGYLVLDSEARVVEINHKGLEILGQPVDKIKGHPLSMFIDRADLAEFMAHRKAVLREGLRRDSELHIVKSDGTTALLFFVSNPVKNEAGKVIQCRTNITDITQTQSEQRYRSLFEQNLDAVFTVDKDGRISDVNPAMERISGRRREELFTMTFVELCVPQQREAVGKHFERGLSGNATNLETTITAKDGRRIDLLITGGPVVVEGQVAGMFGIAKDITEHKQAEEALKKYELFARHSHDIILFIRRSDGRIIEANETAITAYGLGRDELLTKSIYDLRADKNFKLTESQMDAADASGILFETIHLRKDGSTFCAEVSSQGMTIGEERVLLSVIRDITERKRAQDDIKRNEARLEGLLRISQHHVGSIQELLDFALNEAITLTDSKIGYIYHYNEAKKEFTLDTWSRDVMKQCTIAEPQTVYQLDKTGIWGEAVRQAKPIIVNDFHAQHPLKKGYPEGHSPLYRFLTIPIFSEGHIVGVVGVANKETDYDGSDVLQLTLLMDTAWKIAERKRAEEALQESEQRYRNLFESMDEGFALCEMIYDEAGKPADFRYISVNPAFARVTGLPTEQVVGRTVREVIPGIEPFWIESYGRVVQSGLAEHFDSSVAELERQYEAYAWRSGIGRFAVVFSDVSERKRATKELERLRDELEYKNEELESIIRIASHDLRSPLVNIKGFSGELAKDVNKLGEMLKGVQLPQDVRQKADMVFNKYVPEGIGFIQNSADFINQMIKSLMDVAKAGTVPVHITDLDMNALLAKVRSNAQFKLKENGGHIEVEPLPKCRADSDQMTQVFTNLVENAIKYREPSRELHIQIYGSTDADKAIYCVEDNGKGIEEECLDKVFNLFTRLDPEAAKGEGIGLTIVKRMVERQDGKIWVDSEVGKGSKFFVSLPR